LFGSGWAWLIASPDGLLVHREDANQDSPLDGGQDAGDRAGRVGARLLPQVPEPPPEYIEAWWNVVDWEEADRRYQAAVNS
jgi:Fe-Mn family superoxide dismutase